MNSRPTGKLQANMESTGPKTSRAMAAADEIAQFIFSGTLKPGQQLVEDELAQLLHVSRAPVREALRELSREGLVHVIARRGAFVARMDRTEVAELYEVRAVLEAMAAGICAEHIGAKPMQKLHDLVDEMRDAASAGDVDRYSRIQFAFHIIVWEQTPNRILREMIRQLWRRTMKFRLISLRLPGRLAATLDTHVRLLDALRRRDVREAESIRWLALQSAKHALMTGYFGQTPFDQRVELERDLPDLANVAPRLEPLLPDAQRLFRRKRVSAKGATAASEPVDQ